MIVTDFTRKALAVRREDRRMEKLGYRKHETDWEIHRGGRTADVIEDARISVDGKYVWTRIKGLPTQCNAWVSFRCCELPKWHDGPHFTSSPIEIT